MHSFFLAYIGRAWAELSNNHYKMRQVKKNPENQLKKLFERQVLLSKR